jgi:TonB family protein
MVGIASVTLALLLFQEAPTSFDRLGYPPLARAARIQGTVILEFAIGGAGEPVHVVVISGHPVLVAAAKANLTSWRFPPLPTVTNRRRVTYIFQFSDDFSDGYYDSPRESFAIDTTGNTIRVVTAPPGHLQANDCPSKARTNKPLAVQAGDFVTIGRTTCYGTCPAYRVTIHSDGRVEWSGQGFVEVVGDREHRIAPEQAGAVILKFAQPKVQDLCGDYSRSVTDNPSVTVEIKAGGVVKTISDYADAAPRWFRLLRNEIDAVAGTHVYRHGDAKTEPVAHIQGEYLPKPGMTRLMRAAGSKDLAELTKLLAEGGVSVNAVDDSGWTALMYAAANGSAEVVDALLRAGADPSHVSPYGDTVLMAAALSGNLDRALARLARNINLQNRDGVTALMLVASKGDAGQIKEALKAGARARTKDRHGRTALDYLKASACSQPIVRGSQQFLTSDGPCKPSGSLQYRRARGTLQLAMGY